MRHNREHCFAVVELDEDDPAAVFPRALVLPALWAELGASKLPSGLDCFCLDAALMCEVATVKTWLELLPRTAGPTARDRLDVDSAHRGEPELEVANAIRSIEFFWRRRLRVDPGWAVHGPAWSNRVNRAKRRAFKMIQQAMELEPT